MSRSSEFDDVLQKELEQVDQRRRERQFGEPPDPVVLPGQAAVPPLEKEQAKARQRQLVGLAFSGGGIRSATFNLGFLQGLAGLGLLKMFDYLSTVSGGSYIGGWLAAWMRHQGTDDVEKKLQPKEQQRQTAAAARPRPDPDPILHLRRHSNYLAPRQGFFGSDRWVLYAIYLRNFLLNQLGLLPAAMLLLLLARFVMLANYPFSNDYGLFYQWTPDTPSGRIEPPTWWFYSNLIIFLGGLIVAIVRTFEALLGVRGLHRYSNWRQGKRRSSKWILGWIVVPLGVAALAFCFLAPYPLPRTDYLLRYWYPQPACGGLWPWWIYHLFVFMAGGGGLVLLGFGLSWQRRLERFVEDLSNGPTPGRACGAAQPSRPLIFYQILSCCLVSGMAGGAMLYQGERIKLYPGW